MDNEKVFEWLKDDMKRIAHRVMSCNGNNFEATQDYMETVLDIVLSEIANDIYK